MSSAPSPLPAPPSDYFASLLLSPPPLNSFDAFSKTQATYKERTTRGGLLTVLVGIIVGLLVWYEAREYLFGEANYEFSVDRGLGTTLQLNFDATVATPCHYLTVDVRDAVGDRLHISDEFNKDGTTFEIGQAQRLQNLHNIADVSASKMVRDARGGGRRNTKFPRTAHQVADGPACRVYGSMGVKKVTGNLHITTLGHGYLSWEHTDHALMNLSHVIHEFSFGPFFPRISQPLDNSAEVTEAHFHIFQYFVSVVATTYIDAGRRLLKTNQYSVTDMSRITEHGRGVPGIFFKYDIEPMHLTVRERTTTLLNFLVRLAGIVGGVLVCSDYGFRTFCFFLARITDSKLIGGNSPPIPTSIASPIPPHANSNNSGGGFTRASPSVQSSNFSPGMVAFSPSAGFGGNGAGGGGNGGGGGFGKSPATVDTGRFERSGVGLGVQERRGSYTSPHLRSKEKRSVDWARKRRNSTRSSAVLSDFTSTLIFERRTQSHYPDEEEQDEFGQKRESGGNLSERVPVIVLKVAAGWSWDTEALTTSFVRENYQCSLASSPTSTLSCSSSSFPPSHTTSPSSHTTSYASSSSRTSDGSSNGRNGPTTKDKGKGKELPLGSLGGAGVTGRTEAREERTTLEPESIHIVPTDIYVAQEEWL